MGSAGLQPTNGVVWQRIVHGCVISVLAVAAGFCGGPIDHCALAQEAMQENGSAIGRADLDSQIQNFVKRLAGPAADDGTGLKFLEAIQRPSGRIAIANRVAIIDEELRKQAANEALPEFLNENFEKQGERFVLREGRTGFAEQLSIDSRQFDDDVSALSDKLKSVAALLKNESESDRLLARALENDLVPAYMYIRQLREAMHPGVRIIQERLASAFAVDRDGKMFVREQAVEGVALLVEQLRRAEQVYPRILDEFHQLGDEIFEADEFHGQFKRRLSGDNSAAYISVELTLTDQSSLNEQVDNYFRSLEQMFQDTSDGLIINSEMVGRLKEAVEKSDTLRSNMELLREPLVQFAAMIDESRSPLDKEIKQLLQQPIGLVAVAKRVDVGKVNVENYVQNIVDQTLETGDDGSMSVRSDREEAVTRYVQDLLRGGREIRRQLNVSNEVVENLADEELRTLMSSLAARFVIMQLIRQRLASQNYNAFAEFTASNFEETESGLVAKPDAAAMMTQVIEQAARIEQELDNDDF